MIKGITSILFFFLFLSTCIAQKPPAKIIIKGLPVAADCETAILLKTASKITYGPTVPPRGYGKTMEIKACDDQDIFTFQRERNSSWYKLFANEDGDLVFEIISINPKNDYDFMLYKWTDSTFCDELKSGNLLPIRTNLSHTDNARGVELTGLSAQANSNHVPLGVGLELSYSLPVKKGELYYLVVDNVQNAGQGHTLNIYYFKEITLTGTVLDEKKQPVSGATAWIESRDGKIIDVTKCDENGSYSLKAKIKDDEFYSVLFTSDQSFIECRQILQKEFDNTNFIQTETNTTLRSLELGKKYVLHGISYNKNTKRLHAASYPTLNALASLMLKNKSLKVQIEGHVNSPAVAANTGEDKIRGQRIADEVYNYLLNKGIANTRIVPTTFGSLYMIYPKPKNQVEIDANNRIEIFFLPEK